MYSVSQYNESNLIDIVSVELDMNMVPISSTFLLLAHSMGSHGSFSK